jgi:uncharacterized protein (UPF0333 family)
MIMKKSIMIRTTAQDERGQSISLFVLVIMSALIITTGLVIDGGQKVTATSRAEAAAAAAVIAAKTYLAGQPGVQGTVFITNGVVVVATSAQEPTIFLSVIGIGSIVGRGSARANIVATGASR